MGVDHRRSIRSSCEQQDTIIGIKVDHTDGINLVVIEVYGGLVEAWNKVSSEHLDKRTGLLDLR